MLHVLKCDPLLFLSVYMGDKKVEIRKNDRNFQVGDILSLHQTKYTSEEMSKQGKPLQYTGSKIEVIVTHIINGPFFGLKRGWCAMSIKLIGEDFNA